MKILITTQHGDERLGQRLYRSLKTRGGKKYDHVDFLCGNPKAYRANVRYIETDLNRSYGTSQPETYEEKRARKIVAKVASKKYDYILDIHTSRSPCDKLLISSALDAKILRIINATNINRVVVMPHQIAKRSFIGSVDSAISIEYDRKIAHSRQTLDDLICIIDNLSNTKRKQPSSREVFFVDNIIKPDLPIDENAKNFNKCNLGFYPILFTYTGGSYEKYRGFQAKRKKKVMV